jgi:pectin methylesterase-like acyl-CoA thioesterase
MKHLLLKRKHLIACFLVAMISLSKAFAYDVVVAKDGSGSYTTVHDAIANAPTNRTTPYTIYIKNGKYLEKDTVPTNKPFIQLIGESVANVIISWNDYSGKAIPGGGGATFGTGNSATFTVNATDFTAINITFENTTGEQPQALAINVIGDRAAFKNCRFLGGQDTVFAGGNGARQYFRACYIDGTVDFIFGDARAIFDSTVIYPKSRSVAGASYITAANTKQTEPYGYVFRDCVIPANRGTTVYYLGRPWQNDASTADAAKSWNKTIFLNTTMSPTVIQPAGWSTWDAGTDVSKITYAEYRSKKFDSTLVDVSQRVSWSQQLSPARAAVYYNNDSMFTEYGNTWNPCNVYAGFCDYTPRPIAVSNFKGVKGSSTSALTWNISWPMTGILYELLRSSDKTNFTVVNQQTSTNDSIINFGYSENIPPPGQTYYYLVRASKAGLATQITDTVTISSTPTITVNSAMGSFVQGVGTPSTSQSYTVSAASLTNNLIITAPTGYEVSANSGTSWNNSGNPLVLTPDANGNVTTTNILVRLNASTSGTYSGNIIHASVGADTVRVAVTGTVQDAPLTVSSVLEWWPLTTNNSDSAAVRVTGVVPTTPTLKNLNLSDATAVPTIPAYSPTFGQAFALNANGSWTPTLGGTLNRNYYEEFTITAASTHSLRLDSLILSTSIYNSSNGKFAAVFSKSGFTTDSTDVPTAAFASPISLANETSGTVATYRFAFNGGTGINLTSGQTLTVRLYYAVGSSSTGRYAKLKNVLVKGLATANPIVGDYRSHQSGDWKDVNAWERWDGSTWVTPAPAYPKYSNSNLVTVLNGHIITASTASGSGSDSTKLTTINKGGQIIVATGGSLTLVNDSTTTATDLKVDGVLTVNGTFNTTGKSTILNNGTVTNSGTFTLASTDTLTHGPAATYQHNINSQNVPTATWQLGSTLLITGLTTSQTNIFKNSVTYSNIIWNNTNEANYYAYRLTLDSANVKGSFTVQSTGSTYITFANTSGRVSLPGGYYQTGGTVNFRESGNITDTLDIGGDFSVTGGKFISNMGTGSSLLVRLNGVNKTLSYSQNTATNTNWQVNGSYTLGANDTLPNGSYGVTVNGTLNTGTFETTGSGSFTVNPGATLSSGSPLGLNGNITVTGTKTFSTSASYIFNGTAPQVTGTLLPATVNALIINNASDVTLSGSVNVTNALTLTNGHLILGSNNITTASVVGASSAKYVVTNGTGALKITNVGAGSNLFPVGTSINAYNPATLNNAGTADNFSVSVKNTIDNPVPNPSAVVNKQWTITEETAGGSNVTVSLSWTTADQAAGFNPSNATSIMRWNGTSWEARPATITGAGTTANPYVATASGFTAFSAFIVANDAALPLNLLTFNASYTGNSVNILWNTTNELNTASYIVERSADGRTFISLSTVAAQNVSAANYSTVDANPLSGIAYYRLKITDKDGAVKYSKVVVINTNALVSISIYPNPATNAISITHTRAVNGAMLEIVSMDGKRVAMQKMSVNAIQTTVDVSTLAPGNYMLLINNGVDRTALKFVKQ